MTEDETAMSEPDVGIALATISRQQVTLRDDFERLAAVIEPIASRTYAETQARMRVLEQRILSRQERPTVQRLAQLLVSTQRLSEGADVRAHVEESILDILHGLGYEQFGVVGEPYDEQRHDVLTADAGRDPHVVVVHARGLESFGDVIIRARVDIGGHSEGRDDMTGSGGSS
jgi:molecular chaperone GrpE (heat shock protein)